MYAIKPERVAARAGRLLCQSPLCSELIGPATHRPCPFMSKIIRATDLPRQGPSRTHATKTRRARSLEVSLVLDACRQCCSGSMAQ